VLREASGAAPMAGQLSGLWFQKPAGGRARRFPAGSA